MGVATYLLLQNILIICLVAWMTRKQEELVGLTFWNTTELAEYFPALCVFLIATGAVSYLLALLQLFKGIV